MMSKTAFDPSADTGWIHRLSASQGLDPVRYLLNNPGDTFVAEQLHCYPRAAKKFPGWHQTGMAYTKTSFEQSSGEIAARNKARMVAEIQSAWNTGTGVLIDLSGGLGVDTMAFAEVAQQVHYVDPDPEVLALARNNHRLHGYQNITYHCSTAEDILHKLPDADWIYIDPSRRNPKRRVFLLNDSQPDVPALWPIMRQKARSIMLKLSPMYDLSAIRNELDGISQISVVSVNGEVKEILAVFSPESVNLTEAVCLPEGLRIMADAGMEPLHAHYFIPDIKSGNLIYRPDAAILKAGVMKEFANQAGLKTISGLNSLLVGQDNLRVPGADAYSITEVHAYKPKQLKKMLKGSKVNIHAYSFPVKAEDLYSIFGVKMGDQFDVFCVGTGSSGTKTLTVMLATRIAYDS